MMSFFFASSNNRYDVNILHRLCVNRFQSALQLTPVIASYFCCIITILVLIVKLYQENIPIESIYTIR